MHSGLNSVAPLRRAPRAAAGAARVPAVTRALVLLDLLARRREAMSLARLAADLDLPKSSVHGLCNTLESFGYLRRDAAGGFRIGPGVMGLAEAFVAGTSVAHEFDGLWTDPAAAPEETIVLSVLDGREVLYIAARHGARPLGLAFSVGMRLPAHLAATGRAILAYHDSARVRQLARGAALTRPAVRGPTNIDELLAEVALTRRRGYSIDDEGVREGVYCLGAPVFDAAGMPVAGVGVCIHKSRQGGDWEARQREVVLAAARTLTQRLGGRPPEGADEDRS